MVDLNRSLEFVIEEVTDPNEIARHRAQDERHARNLKWLESHWGDLPHARGRYVAVANEQPFVADTAEAAWNYGHAQSPPADVPIGIRGPASGGWMIYLASGAP